MFRYVFFNKICRSKRKYIQRIKQSLQILRNEKKVTYKYLNLRLQICQSLFLYQMLKKIKNRQVFIKKYNKFNKKLRQAGFEDAVFCDKLKG